MCGAGVCSTAADRADLFICVGFSFVGLAAGWVGGDLVVGVVGDVLPVEVDSDGGAAVWGVVSGWRSVL